MILCGGGAVICFCMLIFLRRHPAMDKIRNPCRILLLFCVLGCMSEAAERFGSGETASGEIERREPGEGDREETFFAYLTEAETEYPLTLTIEERKYQKAEEKRLLEEARKEIAETFCGQNASVNEIRSNPVVSQTYQNGAVSAEWLFSEEDVISPEGEIHHQALGEDAKEAEAVVSLSCGERQELYRFSFTLIPKKKRKKDITIAEIQKQIQNQDRTKATVELPEEINGQEIRWRAEDAVNPAELFGFGMLAAAAAAYIQKEQKEKQMQQRKRNLLTAYPEFVSKLSLLLGAGMTISGALRKINRMHQPKKRDKNGKDAVYEELYEMICKMDNGMSELRAYQEFAKQCGVRPYRKLSFLLIFGQKTGVKTLLEQLNQEAETVFAERKNNARKFGEEAGIRMLLPMMMMLIIVMGIVTIPAFLAIYGA